MAGRPVPDVAKCNAPAAVNADDLQQEKADERAEILNAPGELGNRSSADEHRPR